MAEPRARKKAPPSGGGGLTRLGGRMTPAVLWLVIGSATMFVLWAFGNKPAWMIEYVLLSDVQLFGRGFVWQLLSSLFLETSGLSFAFSVLAMWLFVPALERHWGARRFLFYFLSTGVLANIAAVSMARALGQFQLFGGFSDVTMGVVVAYGVLWGRAQVSFFGVLPMTARQLTLVILFITYLQLVISGNWPLVVATTTAVGYTLLITSYQYSPTRLFERIRLWRIKRKYRVISGGKGRSDKHFLN